MEIVFCKSICNDRVVALGQSIGQYPLLDQCRHFLLQSSSSSSLLLVLSGEYKLATTKSCDLLVCKCMIIMIIDVSKILLIVINFYDQASYTSPMTRDRHESGLISAKKNMLFIIVGSFVVVVVVTPICYFIWIIFENFVRHTNFFSVFNYQFYIH